MFKSQKKEYMTILHSYYLVQGRVIIWSKLGVSKKG